MDKKESSLNLALKKIIYYLKFKDHSLYELKQKLLKSFDSVTIEQALEEAQLKKLLIPQETLSLKIQKKLHEKLKSHRYICFYLEKKNFPFLTKLIYSLK